MLAGLPEDPLSFTRVNIHCICHSVDRKPEIRSWFIFRTRVERIEQPPGAEQIKLKPLVGHCLLPSPPGQASSRTPTFQLLLRLRGSCLFSRIRAINFGRKAVFNGKEKWLSSILWCWRHFTLHGQRLTRAEGFFLSFLRCLEIEGHIPQKRHTSTLLQFLGGN